MNYPKSIWLHSAYTEAVRILQIAHNLKNGFYLDKGFYILPYLVKKHPKMVYFPKLNFKNIPDFWEKVKERSQRLVEQNDPIIARVADLLPKVDCDFADLKSDWQKDERKFWNTMRLLVPDLAKGVKTIEIRPTNYGTVASGFSVWLKKNSSRKIVYVRADVDVSHIAEALLIDLMYKSLFEDKYRWEEAEGLLDSLLTKSELKNLFPNFRQTLYYLRDPIQGKYIRDSKKYIQQLGIKEKRSLFAIRNKTIFIKNKPLTKILTPIEEKILSLLIRNKNKVVNSDQLAEIIWGKESYDKFSSYAIAKHIQRIREKIISKDFSQPFIQTYKKRGYILHN